MHNRHQTLEDLRTELRTRSQELTKELLDLVNENYQDFLSLGSSLQGGGEKVEEVRLGLMGFRRDVTGLKAKITERRKEIQELVGERKRIRSDIQLARNLLEVNERIDDLEEKLMVVQGVNAKDGDGEFSDSDEESEEEDGNMVSASRLRRHAQQLMYLQRLVQRIGPDHPFLLKQDERLQRLRQTILLDLSNALKSSSTKNDEGKRKVIKLLGIYREMGESGEALQVLKLLKT